MDAYDEMLASLQGDEPRELYCPCGELEVTDHVCPVTFRDIQNQLVAAQRQNELYVAEMSEAKSAGFETAQDLYTSYKALQQQILEQQAVIEHLWVGLEFECGGNCNAEYNPCNARNLLNVLSKPSANVQALTDHVNAEKVKMLINVRDFKGDFEQSFDYIDELIAELTKPTGEE